MIYFCRIIILKMACNTSQYALTYSHSLKCDLFMNKILILPLYNFK